LMDTSEDAFMKASVLDLIKALLFKLDEDRISKVYILCMDVLKRNQKSHIEEKKAYRWIFKNSIQSNHFHHNIHHHHY